MTKISKTSRSYGWTPDVPNHRDHLYAAPVVQLAKLPAKVDLRPHCPPLHRLQRAPHADIADSNLADDFWTIRLASA